MSCRICAGEPHGSDEHYDHCKIEHELSHEQEASQLMAQEVDAFMHAAQDLCAGIARADSAAIGAATARLRELVQGEDAFWEEVRAARDIALEGPTQ